MDVSTVIAIVALLFSFGTTAVSYKRSVDQDIANNRKELREVLQRLVALPKENIASQKTYENDPNVSYALGSLFNQENSFLIAQTEGILGRLPDRLISAGEFFSVAVAFQNVYDLDRAVKYFQTALDKASRTRDFNTEVPSLRNLANICYMRGDRVGGATRFQQALDIFGKYPSYDPYTKLSTSVITEIGWATSARNVGEVLVANQHLRSAEDLLKDHPQEAPGIVMLRRNLETAKLQLGLGNGVPSAETPGPFTSA